MQGEPSTLQERVVRRTKRVFADVTASLLVIALPLGACAPAQHGRLETVSLRVHGEPANARVTVDDIPIGELAYVASRGVALPKGQHRISVEADGYFPFDVVLEARDKRIELPIVLRKLPE